MLDSATYEASQYDQDLSTEFKESRAERAWLRWIEVFSKREWSLPLEVAVDWNAGIVRTRDGRYGCLEDVEECLYERGEAESFIPKPRPPIAEYVTTNAWQDLADCAGSLDGVPATERKALIDARLGQGKFREQL
jgi:hypothetical protein